MSERLISNPRSCFLCRILSDQPWIYKKDFIGFVFTLNDEIRFAGVCKCCNIEFCPVQERKPSSCKCKEEHRGHCPTNKKCIQKAYCHCQLSNNNQYPFKCPRPPSQCISQKDQRRIEHLRNFQDAVNERAKSQLSNNADWYAIMENCFKRVVFKGNEKLFFELRRTYGDLGKKPTAVCEFVRNIFLEHWNDYCQQWDETTVVDTYSGLHPLNGKLSEYEIYDEFWGDLLQPFLKAVFSAVRDEIESLKTTQADFFKDLRKNTPCLRNLVELLDKFNEFCEYSDIEPSSNLFDRSLF